MKLSIIVVGKTKDAWIKEGVEEYLKRLSPYAIVHYEELPDSKAKDKNTAMKEEGEALRKRMDQFSQHWLLDPKGDSFTSPSFAENLLATPKSLGQPVQLFVAGAFGLHPEMKKDFSKHISLSPLTFTHQMTRVILLEQLYRGFTILQGKSYHY